MREPRLCCNCLHCARWKKKDGIECHCDLTDKYLGYLTVMDEDNDCKHWEKETKWDLQREHDKQIRSDAIEDFEKSIITEIRKWYWDADKQEIANEPCVVDALTDLFIRTVHDTAKGINISR